MYSGETGLACPLTDVDFLILAKTCLRKAGAKVDNKKIACFFSASILVN